MNKNENDINALKEVTFKRQEEILKKYEIDDINDPINVQKRILNKLQGTGFYQVVVNDETGMNIELTKKGIKETFCSSNFKLNPKLIKLIKIDVLEQIPSILKTGHIDTCNYRNYHKENSELEFNYLYKEIDYFGYAFSVRCDIRKSNIKNLFWVHQIIFDIKK